MDPPSPANAGRPVTISIEVVIIGALTGLTYAVLAAGLVLVYRSTRVINFAHAEIGAFGAALLAKMVLDWRINFFVALAAVMLLGGALGATIELGIVRRLFRSPRLILLVATIGVAQLLFVLQLALPDITKAAKYPSPLDRSLHVGNLVLGSEHFMVLAFVPAIVVGLAIFLNGTPYGVAIRAAAENADAAELAGISAKRVSTMVWVLAGVLSALSAVLINPLRGTVVGLPSLALGPALLLRALAAALSGRLVSLPRTLVGGVLIGIAEAILFVNVAVRGVADLALFGFVLLLLLLRRGNARSDEGESWSLSPKVRPMADRVRQVWWMRRLNQLLAGAGLVVAVVLPVIFTQSSQVFLLTSVLIYTIIALSVTILTGWAGQLSLGQFAFVGLGAMTTAALVSRGMPFVPAAAYATVGGGVAATLVGFPALRVRGLFLAVATLAFAVAASTWIFTHPTFVGQTGVAFIPRTNVGPIDLAPQRTYYYLCLFVLAVCMIGVANLRSSGIGRTIIAVRDNQDAASSFTVSPAVAKLSAFAVAGALAALAGALLGGQQVQFSAAAFGPQESLRVVAMTVIGGLGSIGGALLGAVYVVGLPALFGHNPSIGLLTSGIGLLLLLLYLPGGLAQLAYRLRDTMVGIVERRLDAQGLTVQPPIPATARRLPHAPAAGVGDEVDPGVPALTADHVTVAFGGRKALTEVSLWAGQGEVVGLIGSNGAGKSTLMNVISGFVPADAGHVEVFGVDITSMAPHERARLGIGRVFQDARLFGDLTVRETVQVALETGNRSELVPAMLSLPPARRGEATKSSEADEYIAFLGLGRYANSFLSDLSTGTRRIVDLCCLLAQRARLVLLDEPTAGVAQRETEAFGPLIRRIQSELGATLVVIEHDMPLVMSISDRIYCLAAGTCIAEGLPNEVRNNPQVIAAYLGTDERAIRRSGAAVDKPISTNTVNLAKHTRSELFTLAGERGIHVPSRAGKAELLVALEDHA